MKANNRVLPMILGGVGILGLGFVVAMASATVPGRQEEPLFDMTWRPGNSVTVILTWLVAITAVIGAVVLLLAVKEPRTKEGGKRKRTLLALVVGLILFALAWRYLRPAAEALLTEESELVPDPVDPLPVGPRSSNPIWALGALVALVVIAALVRLGLSLRSPKTELAPDDVSAKVAAPPPPTMAPRAVGIDPRSRVIGAYLDFEEIAERAGVPREPAETANSHARRVVAEFDLPREDARALVNRHSAARFGAVEPSDDDATRAEKASAVLCERMVS